MKKLPDTSSLKASDSAIQKIQLLIQNHMKFRFATPDKSLTWFSFNDGGDTAPFTLNDDDCKMFPLMVIDHARNELTAGNIESGAAILQSLVRMPMRSDIRNYALNLLDRIQSAAPPQRKN